MPADRAVTTPVVPMVATAAVPLVHTPPEVALVKLVVEPTQALVLPLIAATTGSAFTVIVVLSEVTQPVALVRE